jgi:hypothetical protein
VKANKCYYQNKTIFALFFNKTLKMWWYITNCINREEKMRKKLIIFTIVFLFFIPLIGMNCSAQDEATDYAPILYFEGEETCYPVTIDYHLENSYLYEVGVPTPIDTPPISSSFIYTDIGNLDNYYLDNQRGSPDNPDGIINHYKGLESSLGYTVYYRTYTSGNTVVVQYWLFYAFNKGELNQHEGDWEMVQVVIENGNPSWVAYSQHHIGQWATWDQVEREGNHIKVYVARGSHANYLRSFSGVLGMARDFVGSNGKTLEPVDYTLKSLDSEAWSEFVGRWGECDGEDPIKFVSSDALGRCGTPSPMYREDGYMWNDPVSWGKSVPQANDMLFTGEWFFYNFALIYILITIAALALIGFFIYRRHKKYGLGPRIVSLLYIDGINLKSIGNIICIVGIILAILGLFYPWYILSYDLSEVGSLIGIEASGMQDLLSIDGINGVQVTIPGESGAMPLGTIAIPFSIIIGVGILFLIIATIGINHSKKLGWKYIWRGIRLLVPVIVILVVIMAIGSLVPAEAAGSDSTAIATVTDILNSISGSPFGNQQTFYLSHEGVSVPLPMQWGLGLGALLLLFAGIIIIISGAVEFMANSQLFMPKAVPHPKIAPAKAAPPGNKAQQQPVKPSPVDSKGQIFCTECGSKIKEGSAFCTKCGKKVK